MKAIWVFGYIILLITILIVGKNNYTMAYIISPLVVIFACNFFYFKVSKDDDKIFKAIKSIGVLILSCLIPLFMESMSNEFAHSTIQNDGGYFAAAEISEKYIGRSKKTTHPYFKVTHKNMSGKVDTISIGASDNDYKSKKIGDHIIIAVPVLMKSKRIAWNQNPSHEDIERMRNGVFSIGKHPRMSDQEFEEYKASARADHFGFWRKHDPIYMAILMFLLTVPFFKFPTVMILGANVAVVLEFYFNYTYNCFSACFANILLSGGFILIGLVGLSILAGSGIRIWDFLKGNKY